MNSPQQVWRTYIESWNRHDVEAILDSVTDDFIYDERLVTMDRPLQVGQPFARTSSARSPRFPIQYRPDILRCRFRSGCF